MSTGVDRTLEEEGNRQAQAIGRGLSEADIQAAMDEGNAKADAAFAEPVRYESSPNELTVATAAGSDNMQRAIADERVRNPGGVIYGLAEVPTGAESSIEPIPAQEGVGAPPAGGVGAPPPPPEKIVISEKKTPAEERAEEQVIAEDEKKEHRREQMQRYAKIAAKFYVGYKYGYEKGMELDESFESLYRASNNRYTERYGSPEALRGRVNEAIRAAQGQQVAKSVNSAQVKIGTTPATNQWYTKILNQPNAPVRPGGVRSRSGVQQFRSGGMVRAFEAGGNTDRGYGGASGDTGRTGQEGSPEIGGPDSTTGLPGRAPVGSPERGLGMSDDADGMPSVADVQGFVARAQETFDGPLAATIAQTIGLQTELAALRAGTRLGQTALGTIGEKKGPTKGKMANAAKALAQAGYAGPVGRAVATAFGAKNAIGNVKDQPGLTQDEAQRDADARKAALAATSHPDEVAAMISGTPSSMNPNLTQEQRDAGQTRGAKIGIGMQTAMGLAPGVGQLGALGNAMMGGIARGTKGGTGGRLGAGNGGMAIQAQDPTNWRDRLARRAEESVRAYAGGGMVQAFNNGGTPSSMDERVAESESNPGWIKQFSDWANPLGVAKAAERKTAVAGSDVSGADAETSEVTLGPGETGEGGGQTDASVPTLKQPDKGGKAAEISTAPTGAYDSEIMARQAESEKERIPRHKAEVAKEEKRKQAAPAKPAQAMAGPKDAAKRPPDPVYVLATGGKNRQMEAYEAMLRRMYSRRKGEAGANARQDAAAMVGQMRQQQVLEGIATAEQMLAAGDERGAMEALRKGMSYAPGQISYEISVVNGRMIIQGKNPETGENVAAKLVPQAEGKPSQSGPMVADTDFLRKLRKQLEDPAAFGFWTADREKLTADIAKTRASTAKTETETGYIPDEQARAERTADRSDQELKLKEQQQKFVENEEYKLAKQRAATDERRAAAYEQQNANVRRGQTANQLGKTVKDYNDWSQTPTKDDGGFPMPKEEIQLLDPESSKFKDHMDKARYAALRAKYTTYFGPEAFDKAVAEFATSTPGLGTANMVAALTKRLLERKPELRDQ